MYGHKLLIINGVEDHIHILIGLRPNHALSILMQEVKKASSKWVNDQKLVRGGFYWQEGYAGFSYSLDALPNVIRYMWWRADAGVTVSGGLISGWADQSGNGRNLTATGTFRPTQATSAAMNSQTVVRYGGAQYFTSSFSGPGTNDLTLFLAANGSSYQSLFRFQDNASVFVVYPWENSAPRTFISSSDGGTGAGINTGLVTNANNVGGARYRRNVAANGMRTYLNGSVNAERGSANNVLPTHLSSRVGTIPVQVSIQTAT